MSFILIESWFLDDDKGDARSEGECYAGMFTYCVWKKKGWMSWIDIFFSLGIH